MPPDPNNTPSQPTQFTGNFAVTLAVADDFGMPIFSICFRPTITAGAAVPETAIYKECQPVPPKKKIRFAENILMPAPARDGMPTE